MFLPLAARNPNLVVVVVVVGAVVVVEAVVVLVPVLVVVVVVVVVVVCFPLPPCGPSGLEGQTLANRLAASRNYKHY